MCKFDGNLHIKNTEVCEFVDIQADDFLLVHLRRTDVVQQYKIQETR